MRVIRTAELNDLVFGADMEERQDFDAWALTRAYEIVSQEGYRLAAAAQNLDKKSTRDNGYQLMQAIAASLREARAVHIVA